MAELDWIVRTVEYDLWATERTLEAAGALEAPPEADAHEKLLTILAHVVSTRAVWLGRITGEDAVDPIFPLPLPVEDTRTKLHEVDRAWRGYLATDPDPEGEIAYTSSEATRWVSTLREIAEHVFTHGCYHRGQCAMLIRSLGGKPPATDFIYFSRRAAEAG